MFFITEKTEKKVYVASEETIRKDMAIRSFLNDNGLYEFTESILASATDPMLQGPVPEAKLKCPCCKDGFIKICKGTKGYYLYCRCNNYPKDRCDVNFL